jgi:hypothetical protein
MAGVIGKNVSAKTQIAAVEARIRIQIEPLEVAIQIDPDLPHRVFGQPVALRQALSTSIALRWLSSAGTAVCTVRMCVEVLSLRTTGDYLT